MKALSDELAEFYCCQINTYLLTKSVEKFNKYILPTYIIL